MHHVVVFATPPEALRRNEAYWLQSQSQAGVRLICAPLKAYMI
jgi:hypothetical protein